MGENHGNVFVKLDKKQKLGKDYNIKQNYKGTKY